MAHNEPYPSRFFCCVSTPKIRCVAVTFSNKFNLFPWKIVLLAFLYRYVLFHGLQLPTYYALLIKKHVLRQKCAFT
jgi:hypothetical protein